MTPDLNNRIDRYMNRELHPAAGRALAHEALDDSDLFDELTAVALVQAALESPATNDRGLAQAALDDPNLFEMLVARGAIESSLEDPEFRAAALPASSNRRYRVRTSWAVAIAGAAAVAAGLVTFLVLRPAPRFVQPVQPARSIAAKPAVAPTILLTSDLQPAVHDAPVFRGVDGANRAPKTEGAIVSMEDGIATVNLGFIDGLRKGTELPVIHAGKNARVLIVTVFRDRARGRLVDGDGIQGKDMVRVPNSAHLAAILQQVDALAASGDLKMARELARNSIASGSPGETRQLLERLAALDYQAGAPDAARERYEVAVNSFSQPPAASKAEQASTLASYAALSLLAGSSARAEELLQKALAAAPAPELRFEILNNLGAAAELLGDKAKAAGYYRQALANNSSNADRATVDANLARVGAPLQ